MRKLWVLLLAIFTLSCGSEDETPIQNPEPSGPKLGYYGADLSYVNEMLDCGAEYFTSDGEKKDPYEIFSEAGCNLVRLRLWHTPDWTDYSNFEDVKLAIERSKTLGMQVMLDFHYSDDWADPSKQKIPAAWLGVIDNTPVLGDSLYNYTYKTLKDLAEEDLLPEIVQVGNEINPMILQDGDLQWPIDWNRNAPLLNKGIKAVRDISEEYNKEVGVMLHIAQPENGIWWFEQATENGVTDFDWIGLSYYPLWSDYKLKDVSLGVKFLVDKYDKRLMIVETAYPFTTLNSDPAGNILGIDASVEGILISEEGQLEYLETLEEEILDGGGEGLIYWEPAWVSTTCSTQWGQGSHWDNATLFGQDFKALIGMTWYGNSEN